MTSSAATPTSLAHESSCPEAGRGEAEVAEGLRRLRLGQSSPYAVKTISRQKSAVEIQKPTTSRGWVFIVLEVIAAFDAFIVLKPHLRRAPARGRRGNFSQPDLGAPISLPLIGTEARVLHANVGAALWPESG